ncbi:MAG TPA: Uma2 family endonuclease [Planctomycetaceae bacterium]
MATETKLPRPEPERPKARPEPFSSTPAEPPPPLRNGDRLTLDEFWRRYEAMPGVKAELIDGRVYIVPSPVRHRDHGKPHYRIVNWIGQYEIATPGVDGSNDSTIRLDLDNGPQPDCFLRILPELGGRTVDTEDGYIAGGPELIAEISASSVSYDLHDKLHVYRRHGVKEYLVWRVEDAAIDWFVLRGGRYEPLTPDEAGVLRSETFPGLWLDPAAMLRGDLAAVLDVLRKGLETPEHAAFVGRLRAAAGPTPPGH